MYWSLDICKELVHQSTWMHIHESVAEQPDSAAPREAKLYVVSNGQGSPTLDLRRIPDTLADATVGADLVVIEGMGRAIHTNLNIRFKWVLDAAADDQVYTASVLLLGLKHGLLRRSTSDAPVEKQAGCV